MKKIEDFCRLFFAATFVPISCYDNREQLLNNYPMIEGDINPGFAFLHELTAKEKNPAFIITKSGAQFGIVKSQKNDDFVIIGPCFSISTEFDAIYAFMHEAMIGISHFQTIEKFILDSPKLSYNQFLSTLTFVHYSLNGEVLNPALHFNLEDDSMEAAISSLHSDLLYQSKEEQSFHNTYHFEQQYLAYIKQGQPEKLKKLFLENSTYLKEGQIADNALRQAKNIFIAGTTLSTRSATAGGLDIEQAYQLSDVYINECEKQQSQEALSTLNYSMNLDFARRVEKSKIPSGMSPEIFECIQFITLHTNELIRVEDVAAHVHRSRSYISRKFKAEMGFDLNTFIMRCKLEEAKSLLAHTDKSLSEISSYLCFSSQSYFQNVFKKKYGLTPMQYRNQSI